MVDIKNDIKVLLTKYSTNVIIDDIGGELIIYNNTSRLLNEGVDSSTQAILRNFVFSGVSLSGFPEEAKFVIEDFYGEELRYILHKNYIYVKKNISIDLEDPLGVIRFLPKVGHWAGDYFFAHFLETTN